MTNHRDATEAVACRYCNGFGYVMVWRSTALAEPERVRCGNCSSSGVLPAASEGKPVAWRTMTINLTEQEQEALSRLMAEQELSDAQVFRQALRGYQLDHERRKNGETVSWSGDAQRARDFAGTSAPAPSDQEKLEAEPSAAQVCDDMFSLGPRVFVGCGYIERFAIRRKTTTGFGYMLKGKRISEAKAADMIVSWEKANFTRARQNGGKPDA